MGAHLARVLNGISTEDDEFDGKYVVVEQSDTPSRQIREDPRSPATAGVERTPLPSSIASQNQAPYDPRSPTSGIVRTPLHPPLFDTPPTSPESDTVTREVVIPAPTQSVECEVHRTWNSEDCSVLDEWDSLYPNPDSRSARSDCGSLENLYLGNTTSSTSLDSALCSGMEALHSSPAMTEDPGISPIGTPLKEKLSQDVMEGVQEQATLLSSTPLKQAASCTVSPSAPKGLTSRDPNSPVVSKVKSSKGLVVKNTNSPLALLRQKQLANASNHLQHRSRECGTEDKENDVLK